MVLKFLRQVGVTSNLKRCAVGWRENMYLEYHLKVGSFPLTVGEKSSHCSLPVSWEQTRGEVDYEAGWLATTTGLCPAS